VIIPINNEDRKKKGGGERNVTSAISTAQTQWYCKERCIDRKREKKNSSDLSDVTS